MLRGGNGEITIDIKLPCACVTPCGCKYAGPQEGPDDSFYGGSSTEDNHNANNISLNESFDDNDDDYLYGIY